MARQIGKLSYAPLQFGGRIPEIQSRWLQLSNSLMADWFELLGLYSQTIMSASDGYSRDREPTAPGESRPSVAPVVDYEVISSQKALLHHEFHPNCATLDFASHGLRNLDPSFASIDIAFEHAAGENRVLVKVHIPDEQPPGLYTGAILDAASGVAVGTMSLKRG